MLSALGRLRTGSVFYASGCETRGPMSIGGPLKHGRRLRSSDLHESIATGLAFPLFSRKRCGSGTSRHVFLLFACKVHSLE